MSISDFEISEHAEMRWLERVGLPLIRNYMEGSFPYGVQYGNDRYYRNDELNIVFVVSLSTRRVKTVLTMEQAKANLDFAHRHKHVINRRTFRRRGDSIKHQYDREQRVKLQKRREELRFKDELQAAYS